MSASWVETDRSPPAPGVRNAMERDGMNQTGMRPKPYKSAGRNREKESGTCFALFQTATVTRRNVAGMEVASLRELLFWLLNRASNSFCRSAARPF